MDKLYYLVKLVLLVGISDFYNSIDVKSQQQKMNEFVYDTKKYKNSIILKFETELKPISYKHKSIIVEREEVKQLKKDSLQEHLGIVTEKYTSPEIERDMNLIHINNKILGLDVITHHKQTHTSYADKLLGGDTYFTDLIRKYLEIETTGKKKYKFNLSNGMKMTCGIPFKNKKIDSIKYLNIDNEVTTLDDKKAFLILKSISYICHNSNIEEWFYKICPFSGAYQQLTYMKKHANGTDYIEFWNLGSRKVLESENFPKLSDKESEELMIKEIKSNSKYSDPRFNSSSTLSQDITKKKNSEYILNKMFSNEVNQLAEKENIFLQTEDKSLLICDGRICKIFNDNHLINNKNQDCEIFMYFTAHELRNLKTKINKDLFEQELPKETIDKDVYSYIFNDQPSEVYDTSLVALSRKIIKIVGENIVVLNKAFLIENINTYDFYYKCFEKKQTSIDHPGMLSVSKDLAYCYKCEMINSIEEGDFLALKYMGFHPQHPRKTIDNKNFPTFQIRRIKTIYDNQLILLDKEFDAEYSGSFIQIHYAFLSFSESLKLLEKKYK